MGSKARIAYDILQIILANRKDSLYIEPFVGGCNMIDKVQGQRIGSDINYYLINMWKALQSGWIPPKFVSREQYDDIKLHKICYSPELVGYVGFCCSFSGKWFGGYAGETETQTGIRNYQDEAFRGMVSQVKLLKDVEFKNLAYYDLDIPYGSIVYCDPPYQNTTGYKDPFDHDKFWNWAREVNKHSSVFVSEYTAPEDFKCVWKAKLGSVLSGKNKTSIESLFIPSNKDFILPNNLFSDFVIKKYNL